MRTKKFAAMTAAATLVGALLTVLTPTAAQAADCSPYYLENANGQWMFNSGNYLTVNYGGSALCWTRVNDSIYTTFWSQTYNKNIGLSGNSTASGTRAILATGSSSYTQDWLTIAVGASYFQLQSRANANMCLGVSGGASGTNVALFACSTAANNQLWSDQS